MMNNINFKGKFISQIDIKKLPLNKPVKVSAVELNPLLKSDLKTLREIDDLWNVEFSNYIYKDAVAINSLIDSHENKKFYVLTRQKTDYENLNAADILAEAKILLKQSDNSIYLDYLQVDPDNNYYSQQCKLYKGIGTAFLNFFKSAYKNQKIKLHSLFSCTEFYKKNGFQSVSPNSNNLYFIA